MFAATALLAHQGGWDEIMLVGGPIVVIIVVLAIAKRRVDAQVAALPVTPDGADESGEPDEPGRADQAG